MGPFILAMTFAGSVGIASCNFTIKGGHIDRIDVL